MSQNKKGTEQSLLNSLANLDEGAANLNKLPGFNTEAPAMPNQSNSDLSSKLSSDKLKGSIDKKAAFDPKGKNKQILKGNSKSLRR
ncbi:MAG: hypothetical protein HQL32_01960 [Planctomycetes bacterium]|nr:hypothetical protein [Planctomycetota bacterium]